MDQESVSRVGTAVSAMAARLLINAAAKVRARIVSDGPSQMRSRSGGGLTAVTRWLVLPVAAGVVVLLAGCGSATPSPTDFVGPPLEQTVTVLDVQRLSPREAKALLDNGQAVLYDTRSADSYRISHAAGAISFPEDDAAARLGELPTDKALIFY